MLHGGPLNVIFHSKFPIVISDDVWSHGFGKTAVALAAPSIQRWPVTCRCVFTARATRREGLSESSPWGSETPQARKPAELLRLLSRSRKSSQVGYQDCSSVSVSLVDADCPPPRFVEFFKKMFSRFYLQIWIFLRPTYYCKYRMVLQTVTVLRASSEERKKKKKVFCLHWRFIGRMYTDHTI